MNKIEELAAILLKQHLTMGTAESCMGGRIANRITSCAGSSAYFKGGIVSYCNEVKHRVLGVKEQTLRDFGAVCAQTAEEMAKGALCVLGTTFAVSVTGIAGPGGGTPEKPVGLVYLAAASKSGEVFCRRKEFHGNRTEIRLQTVAEALELLRFAVENVRNPEPFGSHP